MVVKLLKKLIQVIPGRQLKPTELIASITRETTENLTQLALKININRSLLVKTK